MTEEERHSNEEEAPAVTQTRYTELPTAGVLVKVYPSGTAGRVLITTTSLGPEILTPEETVRVLRMALDLAERACGMTVEERLRATAEARRRARP